MVLLSDVVKNSLIFTFRGKRTLQVNLQRVDTKCSISSIFQNRFEFLAHLSTACSRGAFRMVMCPLYVVNNFFKHLLLPNHLANLDQTWQECCLEGPLQKLFTGFDSIKNSDCHGNEMHFFSAIL